MYNHVLIYESSQSFFRNYMWDVMHHKSFGLVLTDIMKYIGIYFIYLNIYIYIYIYIYLFLIGI